MMRIPLSGLVRAISLAVAAAFAGLAANAQTPISLSTLPNADLTTYTDGSAYPQNGGAVTVGGIPFTLSTIGVNSDTAVIQGSTSSGVMQTYTIPVNLSGITTVYTLMDSAFGACGVDIGELDFVGNSNTFTYIITEGTNVRDHFMLSGFCQSATGVAATATYSGVVRLDMQQINLPAGFASDTLLHIDFKSYGAGGEGAPFLAAVTASNGLPATPAPSSLLLVLTGIAAAGLFFACRGRSAAV